MDKKDLLGDMEYARIHGAALFHNIADAYSFVYGNRKAIEECNNEARLVPVAAVPTTAIIETGDKNYYNNLLSSGTCAFAITPGMKCTFIPDDMTDITAALNKYRKPLIIAHPLAKDVLSGTGELAKAFPDLPIILHDCNWGNGRAMLKLLERHQNIYFDISSFHLNNLLEITKEHFGIERALYSSAWPTKSMGAIKALVEYADISESDKDLVASGNACRLLGISPDDFKTYDDEKCEFDAIAKEADEGKPISVPVFDCHTHMVEAPDKTVNTCVMMYSDCDNIKKKMDKLGIDSIITAPWSGISIDGVKGNEESLYAAKKYPGKFYAYSTCNVNYEEDLNEWKKYHEKYPDIFVGIKPYPPFQGFSFGDKVCEAWFEYANEQSLPALIHGDCDVYHDMIENVIPKYPNITFILAHTGSGYDIARRAVACAKKNKNVMLEITYTTTAREMIEFLVSEVGADRVLYGSDLPMRDPAPQLAWVCYAKISEDDKKKILSENIKRIISNIKL